MLIVFLGIAYLILQANNVDISLVFKSPSVF